MSPFILVNSRPTFHIPSEYSSYRLDPKGNGAGSLGIVRKFDSPDGSSIVIKKYINPFDSKDRAQLVLREVSLLNTCRHPNLVKLLDSYTVNEDNSSFQSIYHVTEYCGVSLHRVIEQGRYLMKDCQKWSRELLSALLYLHSHGEIHRNLNTQKICIDQKTNNLTLLGFGRSQVIDRKMNITTERGSNHYMPLEQLIEWRSDEQSSAATEGEQAFADSETLTQPYMPMEELVVWKNVYDAKVDIWSFGVLLWHMITGAPPFVGVRTSNTVKLQLEMCGPIPQDVLAQVKNELDRRMLGEFSRKCERKDFIQVLTEKMLPGRGISAADVAECEHDLRDLFEHIFQYSPNDRISAENALSNAYIYTWKVPAQPASPIGVLNHLVQGGHVK